MSLPPPPGSTRKDYSLTEDETFYIMRTTLLPEHAADPLVIEFIKEYLACRDVRQAAERAGISKRSAETLKKRTDIFECIRQMTSKALEKYGYSAEDVVQKVKEVIDVDIADFQKPDGSWVENINEVPAESRRAIKKFKVKNEYDKDPNGMLFVSGKIIEIELWDKLKAADLLGREKEIFKEKKVIEMDATQNMKDILLGQNKRAEERLQQLRDVTEVVALPLPPGAKS